MAPDAGSAGGFDAGTPCATDAQCNGNACVFGFCKFVDEQQSTSSTQYSIEGIAVAYDDQSQPQVALAYNNSAISGYSHFVTLGPFGTRNNLNSGLWSSAQWSLTREGGQMPWVSWVQSYPGKYGITMEAAGNGVVYNNNERVVSHATARNAAGDEFIASLLAVGTSSTTCEVRFAQKPAGGAWSTPTTVAFCQDEFSGRIALHVLANGAPAILLAESGAPGTLKMLTRSSPLSWTSQTVFPSLSRPGMLLVKERDGVSKLLLWEVSFTSSASNGDYDVKLLTLDDTSITRTVPIGVFPAQYTVPFLSFDVQADGTAYLLRTGTGTSNASPVNVTRVDGATGALSTEQLGTVVRGPYSRTAIGVSPGGEISILHAETLYKLMLRRLEPR